jgi:hypothetical protein
MDTLETRETTEDWIAGCATEFSKAYMLHRARRFAVEQAIYEMLDACGAAACGQSKRRRRIAVDGFLQRLALSRREHRRGKDDWRAELPAWFAQHERFLALATCASRN